MNNLLCCILFCCTASSLVNSDCPTNPVVEHATFNKEEECGDITIRCDEGFTMEQGITCIDGEWKYQEPFCKPPECVYKFTNRSFVNFDHIGKFATQNETECDERCNNNIKCSTSMFWIGFCDLFPAPLISVSQDTDLDQCKAKCTQMVDCLMFSHFGEEQQCYISNVTLSNLPEGLDVNDYIDDTIAEKLCL